MFLSLMGCHWPSYYLRLVNTNLICRWKNCMELPIYFTAKIRGRSCVSHVLLWLFVLCIICHLLLWAVILFCVSVLFPSLCYIRGLSCVSSVLFSLLVFCSIFSFVLADRNFILCSVYVASIYIHFILLVASLIQLIFWLL